MSENDYRHEEVLIKEAEKYADSLKNITNAEVLLRIESAFLNGARCVETELIRERERANKLFEALEWYAARGPVYSVWEKKYCPTFSMNEAKRACEALAAYRASAKEGDLP